MVGRRPSRRDFLQRAAGFVVLASCGRDEPVGLDDTGRYLLTPTGEANPACPDPFAGGTFLGIVAWPEPANPFGQTYNAGWDARRRYDLSRLAGGELEVPPDLFYVRTELPDLLTTDPDAWTVRVDGMVDTPVDVPIAEIRSRSVDQGAILLECSGNAGDFGLMSSARWSGAPLLPLIEASAAILPGATHLLVRGFDEHSVPSAGGHSTPGAEWVFALDDLEDAFLATGLGGGPLPPDNGAPVRLLVPGWYGCACIKWVTHLELVHDGVPATSQMMEFAGRTHQDGAPTLARDYRPARQEVSATVVQVEKWLVDGVIAYRVVGLLWGGERTVSDLRLHVGPISQRVQCFDHVDMRTWNLWSARWQPGLPGTYTLGLTVDDPVPQIRLDLGWYDRVVTIDEPAG